MDGLGEGFKGFLIYFMVFAFLVSFWNSFKADMERRDGIRVNSNYAGQVGQTVKQKLYPATVYYSR